MAHYKRLVRLCVDTLTAFDSSKTSVEDHLQTFLQPSLTQTEGDETFVREVLAGCVRYHQLIKVVVSGYYSSTEGRSCFRSDTHLYNVVAYLFLFRLHEMGMDQWKKLILSLHINKMYKFLSFVLRHDNLHTWITAEWYKVYDRGFVDSTILSPLKRYYDDLLTQLIEMEEHLANKSQTKPLPKPPTEPAPFNLTKPQARSLATPEKIPSLKPHRPVPQSTYCRPAEQERLTQAFINNRERAQATLEEAERTQFACATSEKSEKTKARMEEIVEKKESELKFKPIKPEPAPISILEEGPSVKLNTATVLREGARVQNDILQQEKRLANLEAGEKDLEDYVHWQEDVKQRKLAERQAEVERRHLEARLSYEEAIIARESHLRDVQLKTRAMKEETEELMQAYFTEREEERKELRRLVEASTSQQGAKEARIQLQAMKRNIVESVAAENRVLMTRALEEAEEEMQCKVELIHQIRSMERVPVNRTKLVDLTLTSGQGLLVEMSVTELKERLALLRIAETEKEEKKRREIAATKQEKEKMIYETKQSISTHRRGQGKETLNRRERDEVFSKHHNQLREKTVLPLQDKLQARRKERERLQAERQSVNGRTRNTQTSKDATTPPTITSTLLQY